MKYVKRCLALLLALVMTAVLIQPAATTAKYTTQKEKTMDITLDTAQETYEIKNVLKQGNFSNLGYHENPDGYRVNTNKEEYAATNGMASVGYYVDNSDSTHPDHHRQVWTYGGTLQVEDTDKLAGGTHNIWIYADLNTDTNRATEGHLYYLRAHYLIVDLGETNGIRFRITANDGENEEDYGIDNFDVVGKWSYAQTILQAPSDFDVFVDAGTAAKDLGGRLRIGGDNSGKSNDSTFQYKISHIMLVDLTATFGAGNEPPLWWCNKYIPWDDETISTKKTVQWFPKESKSRLDTAFHDDTVGYYHIDGDPGYYRDDNEATQYRANDATVDTESSITVGGMDHVNSTTLNNPTQS